MCAHPATGQFAAAIRHTWEPNGGHSLRAVPTVLAHRPGTMIAVETLGSKQVYANPWMSVRVDAIRRSDGSTGIYGVVDSPDIALGIPLRERRPETRRRRGGAGRTRPARGNWAFGQQRMINDGTITDAKSTAAYTLLLLHGQTSHV